MYRRPSRPSPSALRSAATLTLRLLSSTIVLGQTRATNSSLLTSSPGRSTRAARMSRARLPRRTGVSPSSKSCRAGKKRNGPNEKQGSVEGAGQSAIFLTLLHLFLLDTSYKHRVANVYAADVAQEGRAAPECR